MRARTRGLLAVVLLVMLRAPDAAANEADRVAAEALFAEGRALLSEGNVTEACNRFASSQRLDASVGALVNLAECAVRRRETATAWLLYREAAALAARSGDRERERAATQRADAIVLSKLVVRSKSKPPGLTVYRDGALVDGSLFEVAVPLNPGTHVIEASAPGYRHWRANVDVPTSGGTVSLDIPALTPEPVSREAPRQTPSGETKDGSRRTTALVVGGLGVAALGVGVGFALAARSTWSDVTAICPNRQCPDAKTAADLDPKRQTAFRDSVIATVAFGAAVVALAASVVLLWTASQEPKKAALVPSGPLGVPMGGFAF